MTRNSRNKELIDWEQQLASIIDRTDENLRHLTSEFNRAKSQQVTKARSTTRRIEGSYDAELLSSNYLLQKSSMLTTEAS
jgi:hypothetical protein